MIRPVLRAQFYETYHFASVVKNILSDQFEYLRRLNDFYGDGNHISFSKPFARFSAFHSFLAFVIDDLLVDDTQSTDLDERREMARSFRGVRAALDDLKPFTLPIEHALIHHGFEFESFRKWLDDNGKTFLNADRCVSCQADLSGLVAIWSEDHFDHMIPLAAGGLNDVTNLQLLCRSCNGRKGQKLVLTSNVYEDWYTLDQASD